VSPEEVHAAVLAFLDQFIGRGAAADIRALRDGLAHDAETRDRLDARLPSASPSEREAFDAMSAFFAGEVGRFEHLPYVSGGPPTLEELIDWMSWETYPTDPARDEDTSDPAQWYDWLASVESGRST
jgi:hypothetical protein